MNLKTIAIASAVVLLPWRAAQVEAKVGPRAAVQNAIVLEASSNSCACEAEAPAAGEAACCETQAAKFGIETVSEANASCCAPSATVAITKVK